MRHVLAFLLLLTIGCAPAPMPPTAVPNTATAGFPMTLTDDAGRAVRLAAPPKRIVSIAPSNTEVLFALGLGDRVVAVDQYSNYPPEATAKPQLGSYLKPDLEQIVAAAPDLVLGTTVHLKTIVPELEARGVPVFVLDAKNLDEVLDRIGRLGRITGEEARAAEVVGGLRARADAIGAKATGATRPRVFFELSPQLHTAGPGSFVDDLIRRAGGENLAADAGAQWPQLSQEVVLERDPEVVLVAHPALGADPLTALRARPGWAQLRAVKAGRVQLIDADLVTRAGPRIVDGLDAIARAVHPDR